MDKLKKYLQPDASTLDAVTITFLQGSKTRSKISPERTAPATPTPQVPTLPGHRLLVRPGPWQPPPTRPEGDSGPRRRPRNRNFI